MMHLPFAHALGWSLIHFIWQGALVAGVLACVLTVLRRRSAHARYLACFAALLIMVALPIVTMTRSLSSPDVGAGPVASVAPPQGAQRPGDEPSVPTVKQIPVAASGSVATATRFNLGDWRARGAMWIEPLMPYAVSMWLAGVLGLALWNLGGWLKARRLMARDVRRVPKEWISEAAAICEQLGVSRPVRLLESARVAAPIVAGILWPVILLPATILTGLDAQQLRAVLAHEVAHIRRYDYAANLLQTAIVTLLFYHPAVWWVSRRIREERENCCDDLAVRVCGNAVLYARALAALAEFRDAPAFALAASGGLLRRVRRIVGAPAPRTHGWGPLAIGASLLIVIAGALWLPLAVQAQEPVVAQDKAELMGRVEDFYLHNYRDVTARKSLEWGDVERDANGNRSIRYMCRATIWDKDVIITNEVFTFDSKGAFVKVEKVPGYPKPENKPKPDVTTKRGMMDLVEDFFSKNFRDITARDTIEWGDPQKLDDGNVSIRYKYTGTIWGKEKKVFDQLFTFNPDGEYVSVEDVPTGMVRRMPDSFPDEKPDLSSPESTVTGFSKAAAVGNAKLARAYFLPEGKDYDDIWRTLTSEPGQSAYATRQMMQAVDPKAPMPILSKDGPDDKLKVVWRVTFAKGFEIEGRAVKPGDTHDFDATLKRTDAGWLISNF